MNFIRIPLLVLIFWIWCCLAGSAHAALQAPAEIKLDNIKLQNRDDWLGYWVQVSWTAVADNDVSYVVQAMLNNSIFEFGMKHNQTTWFFPGGGLGVSYVVRVKTCPGNKGYSKNCSPWTYGQVQIPATLAEMKKVAINLSAPVLSVWETEILKADKEWLSFPIISSLKEGDTEEAWQKSLEQHSFSSFAAVWRSHKDISTCSEVNEAADTHRNGMEVVTRMIASLDAASKKSGIYKFRADLVVPAELAKAKFLAFNGQVSEAIAFLNERLSHRIMPDDGYNDQSFEVDRVEKLRQEMKEILSRARDPKAEQVASQMIDAVDKAAWVKYADPTSRDLDIALTRSEILGEHLIETGQAGEALALFHTAEELSGQYNNKFHNSVYEDRLVARSQALLFRDKALQAQFASKEGRLDIAEKLLRESAKTCQGCSAPLFALAEMLVAEGRSSETPGMIIRLKINVSKDFEELFPCLGSDERINREVVVSIGEKMTSDETRGRQINKIFDAGQTLEQGTRLGNLLISAGRAEDAIHVLEPTLALQRKIFGISHPTSLATLAARAQAEHLLGHNDQAAAFWSEWLDASEEFLSNRLWNVSASSRRDFLRKDRFFVSQFLQSLLESADSAAAQQAFKISLSRKGLLARIAADSNLLVRAANNPRSKPMVERLIKARTELAAKSLMGTGTGEELKSAHKHLADAEAALAEVSQSARQPWMVPSVEQVLAHLADGEALIDFQVFKSRQAVGSSEVSKEHLVAVVVTKEHGVTLVKWPDTTEAQTAINQYRQAMFDLSPNRSLIPIIAGSKQVSSAQDDVRLVELERQSANMYTALWQPLESALKGVKRIYLVPDGYLNMVPFRALKPQGGSYLIEQFELVQLTSPRDVLINVRSKNAKQASATSLLFGAPEFGKPTLATPVKLSSRGNRGATLRDVYFSPLQGSLEEARHISAILKKKKYPATLLTGSSATKSALLAAKSPLYLHLATHGFYLDDPVKETDNSDPIDALARSGLALANANLAVQGNSPNRQNDGILTALEAISLDLKDTRLVTLSACDTGIGMVEPGEGVHGLARSFREAGAQAVVATLWPISDEATSTFMQRFYRRIVDGEKPEAALQHTQVEFMRAPIFRDPLYWAPFVLIGQ